MFTLAKVHFDDYAVETGDDWPSLISFALIIRQSRNPLTDSRRDKTHLAWTGERVSPEKASGRCGGGEAVNKTRGEWPRVLFGD